MLVFISILFVLNVSFFLYFIIRFKKFFNTESVIENTKKQINQILADLNRNVYRDLDLIDDRISRLKQLIAEADKRLRLINDFQSKSDGLEELNSRLVKSSGIKKNIANKAFDSYMREKNKLHSPDAAVSITKSGEDAAGLFNDTQNTLFDVNQDSDKIDTAARVNITSSGVSYAEIPLIEMQDSVLKENNIHYNMTDEGRDKQERVINLYRQGKSVPYIAEQLGFSTTEVQFILDLSGESF